MFTRGINATVSGHVCEVRCVIHLKTALISVLNHLSTKTQTGVYLDQLAGAIQVDLLCQLCCSEHLWKEVVDVGDGLGAKSLDGRGDFVLLYCQTMGIFAKI